MVRDIGLQRNVLIFSLVIPLAVLIGYLLSTPFEFQSYALVGLVFLALAFPILLRWHHTLLILSWNASIIVFFLPGKPGLGVTMAAISFGMSALHRTLRRSDSFISAPTITRPLVLLGLAVVVTAELTGGVGSQAFGNETWGARRYLSLAGAICGYFALTAKRIPLESAGPLVAGYFLSGATAVFSDIIFAAGPGLYFLFIVFSSDIAYMQAMTEGALWRLTGVGFAAQAACWFMIARYGIRGVFDFVHLWRLLVFTVLVGATLFGGYRSSLIVALLTFAFQFWLERLFRTKLFPALVLLGTLLAVLCVPFAHKLPLSVQRSLSFLPLELDSQAKQDAIGTLDWRLDMWKIVVKDVPKYLLLGKGYSFNSTDYQLTQEAVKRGLFSAYEETLVSGNYHSGILTLVIPFGIFGLIAFFWFCWEAIRVLRRNYLYGVPQLQKVNTFLLAYFLGRLLFYLVFYGQFDSDLMQFTGVVGLSLSLNHGVRRLEDTVASAGNG